LFEASPFLRRLALPFAQQSRLPQHPPHAGRAHRHDVLIQHHEGQPPLTFQRILQMKIDDRVLLPLLQPKVPGNPSVVLIGLSVSLPPVVELAGLDAEPLDEPPGADPGLLGPAPDKIHDLIPHVVRTQTPVRVPQDFFLARCAPPSAPPEPHPWSESFSPDIRCVPARPGGWVCSCGGRPLARSRRTPSARGTTRPAVAPARHTATKRAPCPINAASGWRLSLLRCSAFLVSSSVLSVILTVERFLHFQLRRNRLPVVIII